MGRSAEGFRCSRQAEWHESYVIKYRNRQAISRRFTFARHGEVTADEARKKAAALLAEIRLGSDPAAAKKEQKRAETVADMVEGYLAERPNRKKDGRPKKESSWATDASNLRRHVLPLLGGKQAASVAKADLERWRRDVAAGKTAVDQKTRKRGRARVRGGEGVAGRAFDSLACVFAWAADQRMIPSNPAAGIKRHQSRKMQRFLSSAELGRLGETVAGMEAEGELHPYAAATIRLLAATGCRKGEIISLQWSSLDFERRCLVLADSKTGERVIPLGAAALEVLAGLPRSEPNPGEPDWVFPATRGAHGHYTFPYGNWQRVAAKAGLPRVRAHDLRHSWASLAASNGTSLYVVSKLLGHSTQRMSERYAHLSDDPMRAAADATARRISDAMRGCTASTGEVVKLERGKG